MPHKTPYLWILLRNQKSRQLWAQHSAALFDGMGTLPTVPTWPILICKEQDATKLNNLDSQPASISQLCHGSVVWSRGNYLAFFVTTFPQKDRHWPQKVILGIK